MKIESAEVIVTSPGRNFVTLRITTSDGVVGLGDATLNGRELAVAAYLRDHVAPLLTGRDPLQIEDTWQYLYRGGYWRRGPVTMAAIAAVDVALWDIAAKLAGMPLYQLLGGRSRSGLLAYGHASGTDVPALFDSIREHLELGYRAIRVQTAVPGLGSVYGVASSGGPGERYDYEPARRAAVPAEETWDTRAYLRHLPGVFEQVRNEFGPELPLLHDAHHRLLPNEAAQLAKSLEPFRLFWLEDVTPAENQEALRLVRQHSTTPLAIGEVFNYPGLYVMDGAFVSARVSPGAVLDFGHQVFPDAVARGSKLLAYRLGESVIDVGTPEGLALARARAVSDG